MKTILSVAFLSAMLSKAPSAADLLIAMSGGGSVERYEFATGRYVGSFIRGIDRPNALAFGPDGALYVAMGAVGGPGAVKKYDGVTGRFLGDFIAVPAGQPGYLARASDLAWHDGDCFVVSCDDSKVHRYDGRTGAFMGTVASGNPQGWFTQIEVRDGAVFTTEFSEARVRRFPLAGGEPEVFAEQASFTPWGIAFDQHGRCWWSGSGGIARFDGEENAVVVPDGEVTTPTALAISPDGQLVCSSLGKQSVTFWDISHDVPELLVTITGPEVRDPAGAAFTTYPFEAPAQFGNFRPQPSNTGRNWTPTGTTVYNLRADAALPVITEFGVDTEGGDRAKTQLLREPMRLVFTLANGGQVDAWDVPAQRQLAEGNVEYRFSPAEGIDARWQVWMDGQTLSMTLALDGENVGQVTKAELLIPFDPRAMGTTILAEDWGEEGAVKAPLIISALDMGQLRLSGTGRDETLNCRFTGSRLHKRIDLRVELPAEDGGERGIVFAPARLEKPKDSISDADWARVRRGLISLLQITPFMPVHEDGSGWLGSPGGITGNNVISDPVSCNMDRNLQWLGGMGDNAVVMGIDLNKIARTTIEFWLNQRMNEDGSIDYVLQKGNISADSNIGVLNSATDYYLSTNDKDFVTTNKAALARAIGYLIDRDLDDDGLIETFRDGNGNNQFGDTGYDTISSGWKNALVNGHAYKSFLGVAKMMEDIGDEDSANDYRRRALRLRRAYNQTFFQPEKNRYLWWIGQDGKRHDYINTVIQANAVTFGIADCLERDTGINRTARDVMLQLWDDLAAAQYYDSAKGRTVRYMDPATGDYTGLYWGIPGNLEDVPDAYNFADYGKHEFPYYCNGGIFPQDTVASIMAFSSAGMNDKAEIIKREIFRRQHEGILPNGSGFYMGVVNVPGIAYSILKWDGTPTDYEGIISRDCSFLQTAILSEDPARVLFDEALKMP